MDIQDLYSEVVALSLEQWQSRTSTVSTALTSTSPSPHALLTGFSSRCRRLARALHHWIYFLSASPPPHAFPLPSNFVTTFPKKGRSLKFQPASIIQPSSWVD